MWLILTGSPQKSTKLSSSVESFCEWIPRPWWNNRLCHWDFKASFLFGPSINGLSLIWNERERHWKFILELIFQYVWHAITKLAFVYSKSTMETPEQFAKSVQSLKTPERHHWRRSGVFIRFEQILGIVLVFPLLILNRETPTVIWS